MDAAPSVTELLRRWGAGDDGAADAVVPMINRELHRLAERYLRNEHAAQSIQPTELVNQLFLQMLSSDMPDWETRGHFYGVAAHRMRQILVDHARRRNAAKRSGDHTTMDFQIAAQGRSAEIIALDDAMIELEKIDAPKAKVIDLRYFAGLSVEETALAMNISVATVGRYQRTAEAFLRKTMGAAG